MIQGVFDKAFEYDITYTETDIIVIDKEMKKEAKEFDIKFESIYKLEKKGYSKSHIEFGKMLLSNLLGGIGYVNRI